MRRVLIKTSRCTSNYDIATIRNITPEQQQANARLIAAAPELLKELQSILEDMDSEHGNDHDYSKTRTLIARVTGGAV